MFRRNVTEVSEQTSNSSNRALVVSHDCGAFPYLLHGQVGGVHALQALLTTEVRGQADGAVDTLEGLAVHF